MKAHELRDLSLTELELRLADETKGIRELRFSKSVAGQAENPARMKLHRRELARLKTVIREKAGSEQANTATV